MEIDLAISTQKSLGNGGLLNDSDTTDNNVDQPPPANDAPITNGTTGPPLEIDVDQQDANPAPHLAAPTIQQQDVPQQTTIVQPDETLQHGLANGNAGGVLPPDAGPNPQDSGPTQPPRSTTCKFYAQGTCKHGRRGLSCQFRARTLDPILEIANTIILIISPTQGLILVPVFVMSVTQSSNLF